MPQLKLLKLRSKSKDQPDPGSSSKNNDSNEEDIHKKTDTTSTTLESTADLMDRLSLNSDMIEAGSSKSTLDECSSIASTQCAYSSEHDSRGLSDESSDDEDTQSIMTSRSVASSVVSEDTVIGCNKSKKKTKKQKSKEERLRQEIMEMNAMWNATDVQVLEHLLWKKDRLEVWRAVAAARGLCSLSAGCTCVDCRQNQGYLYTDMEGDGGLGAGVPIFTASMAAPACSIQ